MKRWAQICPRRRRSLFARRNSELPVLSYRYRRPTPPARGNTGERSSNFPAGTLFFPWATPQQLPSTLLASACA